jgi:hypothetical protein
MCLHRWPGPVGRQVEKTIDPFQASHTLLKLAREQWIINALSLPNGIIAVLNWQIRKRRLPSGGKSCIEITKLFGEYSERPTITDDVVHAEEQEVLFIPKPQKHSAKQRTVLQIKGSFRLFHTDAISFASLFLLSQIAEVNHWQRKMRWGGNLLDRKPSNIRKSSPQDLVPSYDGIEALLQGRNVYHTA